MSRMNSEFEEFAAFVIMREIDAVSFHTDAASAKTFSRMVQRSASSVARSTTVTAQKFFHVLLERHVVDQRPALLHVAWKVDVTVASALAPNSRTKEGQVIPYRVRARAHDLGTQVSERFYRGHRKFLRL